MGGVSVEGYKIKPKQLNFFFLRGDKFILAKFILMAMVSAIIIGTPITTVEGWG